MVLSLSLSVFPYEASVLDITSYFPFWSIRIFWMFWILHLFSSFTVTNTTPSGNNFQERASKKGKGSGYIAQYFVHEELLCALGRKQPAIATAVTTVNSFLACTCGSDRSVQKKKKKTPRPVYSSSTIVCFPPLLSTYLQHLPTTYTVIHFDKQHTIRRHQEGKGYSLLTEKKSR